QIDPWRWHTRTGSSRRFHRHFGRPVLAPRVLDKALQITAGEAPRINLTQLDAELFGLRQPSCLICCLRLVKKILDRIHAFRIAPPSLLTHADTARATCAPTIRNPKKISELRMA